MTRQFSSVVSRTPGGGPELSDPYAPTENGWSNWHLPSTGVPCAMTAPTSSSITRPPTSAKAFGAEPGWAARCDARSRARSREASKYGFARSRAAFAFSRAKSGGADEALAAAPTINTAAATANERSSFVRELWCTDFKSGPPARDVHHGGDSAQSKPPPSTVSTPMSNGVNMFRVRRLPERTRSLLDFPPHLGGTLGRGLDRTSSWDLGWLVIWSERAGRRRHP